MIFTLNQIILVHTLSPKSKINFNIIFQSISTSSKWHLPFTLLNYTLYAYVVCPMLITFCVRLTFLDFITRIGLIFGEAFMLLNLTNTKISNFISLSMLIYTCQSTALWSEYTIGLWKRSTVFASFLRVENIFILKKTPDNKASAAVNLLCLHHYVREMWGYAYCLSMNTVCTIIG